MLKRFLLRLIWQRYATKIRVYNPSYPICAVCDREDRETRGFCDRWYCIDYFEEAC